VVAARRPCLALVVTAAGKGVRFESRLPKQHVPLQGIPMLQRTLSALSASEQVEALVVVVNSEELERCRAEIVGAGLSKVVAVTVGGSERALSVRSGLQALSQVGTWELVGVHDGARPLVSCEEVTRAVDALLAEPDVDGVVLAIPSVDTIKTVDEEGRITGTPDRRGLWRAQTPQIFRWEVLLSAYAQPDDLLLMATDDSSLVEMRGGVVKVVEGSPENLKITEPSDLRRAESILAERSKTEAGVPRGVGH
jgi:2-C-methyl-D-erythritol 4-phosphate cytidylyltransferase